MNQPQQSYFWQYLVTAAVIAVLLAWATGATPSTGDLAAVTSWLWTLARWTLGIAAVVSAALAVRLIPVAWLKYRQQVTRLAVDEQLIRNELAESNHKLHSLAIQNQAAIEAIKSEQLRTQAELRQMAVHVESLTANKSTLLIDSSQANWQQAAVLLQHPQQAVTSTGDEPIKELPNIIDIMLKCQRMALIAPSGAGKTNLLKHYVARLGNRRLILIDPHSPNLILGRPVVGTGLDFEAIRFAMLTIMHDISRGYQEGDIAQDGDMGELNTWIVIDEWKDILGSIGELAVEFLEMLLVRSRKRGYRVLMINQNDTAKSWGLDGDMGLLQTCARFSINHDIIDENRTASYGWKKSELRELAMPGLFEGYPTVDDSQIITPPRYNPNEQKLLKTLISLNGHAGSTSKAEILRRANVPSNARNKRLLNQLLTG